MAYDGAHAVFKAQSQQPDLILMDVTLPYMSGIAATVAIRRVMPEAKIVFVSGIDDPAVKRAAFKAGALRLRRQVAGRPAPHRRHQGRACRDLMPKVHRRAH